MSELKNQELPVVSLKDVALVLFIDERMKVAAEWGYSERKPLSKLVLDGIDAEANERIRIRLSAALNELKAKDDKLAELKQRVHNDGLLILKFSNEITRLDTELAAKEARIAELEAELDKGDSWAWIRGKFEKCRTQFAWHKPRTDSLAGTRYEVMGWLHVLFAHADPQVYIDITMEHQKKADDANARAEAAEAKLGAVSEVLKEKLERYSLMSSLEGYTKVATGEFVLYADHANLLARLRSIVEGK